MKNNAWNAPKATPGTTYGHLPADMVYDWAGHQAELSIDYRLGKISIASIKNGAERKHEMLCRIYATLISCNNLSANEINARMRQTEAHLDDPGLLENFEFFDVPSSDFMLQFYFAVWDLRIAEAMGYLHNFGKDLKGVPQKVPENDIWYQMSYYEGMNIGERRASQHLVDFIKAKHIQRATSFGGGNIPERLYGLPKDLHLTVFDHGPVSPLEELFPDAEQRGNINYIHEPLSNAPMHQGLLGTQQLVWMRGVPMYLNEFERHEMTAAVLCGIALLEPGGYMRYNYLVRNESMHRVIRTQNWPNDPDNPMVIFRSADDAIKQDCKTLRAVNRQLDGKAFVESLDPEVTLIEPWGITGVQFTVQKLI